MGKIKKGKKYVEDSFIVIPAKGTNVRNIGDLWDCRNMEAVGMNLFGGQLKSENYQAHPRKKLDYTFKHIKNVKDKKFTVGVGIDMTLKVLMIPIKESGQYETIKDTNITNDEIQIVYNIETFSVKCANSAGSLVNETVLKQLNAEGRSSQDLLATHCAVETIVGGEIKATIKIEKTKVTKTDKESSKVFSKIALLILKPIAKGIAAAIGGALGNSDSPKDTVTFTLESELPITANPKTVDAMFSLIDSLDSLIAKQRNYPQITDYEVTGIQLRHVMAPLSSFLSPSIPRVNLGPKLYEEIEKDLKESFLDMVMTLRDYQYIDMIKLQIVDGSSNDRLRAILLDKENLVTKEITEREKQLKIISEEILENANNIFTLYRFAQKNIYDIENVIAEFHNKMNPTELFHEMIQFRNKVRKEYRAIEESRGVEVSEEDTFVSKISTFTNKAQVEDWWTEGNSGKVKIMIQTAYSAGQIGNTLREFWNLDKSLEKFPVMIGIAAPSIFNTNLIRIKAGGVEKSYNEEKFPFVVEVMAIAIGKGSSWLSKTFHELNAALDGIILPLVPNNFAEINNLLANLDGVSKTKICSSYLQLRDVLMTYESNNESKPKYKIVTTLEAEDTAYDAVSHLKRFRQMLSARIPETYSNCEWIIGDFGLFDYNEAPFVFFFKDNQLLAVCFDNLDLLILTDALALSEYNNEEPNLNLLSPANMDSWYSNWLYPTRVIFAKEVAKLYGWVHGDEMLEAIRFSRAEPDELEFGENQRVIDTMRYLRDCLTGDNIQIISAAANIALYYYPDLEFVLDKHSWDKSKKTFSKDFLAAEKELGLFAKDLRSHATTMSPFQAKIIYYMKDIEKAIKKDNYKDLDINRILEELLKPGENNELPQETQSQLKGYQPPAGTEWPMGIPHQVQGIYDILDRYSSAKYKDSDKKIFYLQSLINLVEQIFKPSDEGTIDEDSTGNSEESTTTEIIELQGLEDLAVDYIQKVTDKYEEYPPVVLPTLPKEKLVKHLAKNRIFQALSVLTRCKFQDGYHFLVLQELNELSVLGDEIWLNQFIRKLGKTTFENQEKSKHLNYLYPNLWGDPKFKYLLRTGLNNDSLMECIYIFQSEIKIGTDDNIPKYIPKDFANRLREIAFQRQDFELDIAWRTEEDFVKTLQTIYTKRVVPRDFMLQMTREFIKNIPLKDDLVAKDALFYWDDASKLFLEPWDISTVKKSIDKCTPIETPARNNLHGENFAFEMNISSQNHKIPVEGELQEFCGDSISVLSYNEYSKISDVIPSPEIWKYPTTEWMALVIPFILQRLRMKSVKEYKSDYFVPSAKLFESESKMSALLTRGEIQTCLMSATDPAAALDILRNLVEFPIALPLVTRDVQKDGRLLLLYHLMKQVDIKYSLGLTTHDRIFDTKIFQGKPKIVIVTQIGQYSSNDVLNRILETVLASGDYFTSENSLGTKGSAELIWLTKTTCSNWFWESTVKDFYSKDSTEPILLVKVNGDSMENPAMKILGQMASSMMVFLMPNEWTQMRSAWKKFRVNLGTEYRNLIRIMVDPTPSSIGKANNASKIRFDLLMNENKPEMDKLHALFAEAILFRGKSYNSSGFVFNDKIVSKEMINSINSIGPHSNGIRLFDSNLKLNIEDLESLTFRVKNFFPNLRIYVISISGMKKSGKSTLLNALFGTKFQENSDGIECQLIFLNDDLKQKFYADAFLVIDSEGMNSTTKIRQTKDTKLASLILSLSNICIVNIMGSRMKELNSILNVALVSQMRYKNPIENCPGIVLAEQTAPGKNERVSANLAELMGIVQNTIEFCSDRETDIGLRVRTSQRILNTIVNTKVWELLKKFRRLNPFTRVPENIVFPPSQDYYEDVLDFYKILLKNFKTAPTPLLFTDWIEIVKENAKLIVTESFNQRFDSMEDLQSYFDYSDTFRDVKDNYDHALRIHQLRLEKNHIYNKEEELEEQDLETMLNKFASGLQFVPDQCEEEENECFVREKCLKALDLRDRLLKKAQNHSYLAEFETRLAEYKRMVSDHIVHQLFQKLVIKKMRTAIQCSNVPQLLEIFSTTKDFADIDETNTNGLFQRLYSLTAAANYVIPSLRVYKFEIEIEYEFAPHIVNYLEDSNEDALNDLPKLDGIVAFDVQPEDSLAVITWHEKEWLENQLSDGAQEIYFYSRDSQGKIDIFEFGMGRKWRLRIDEIIQEFENKCRKSILVDFRWAVHEYGVKLLGQHLLKLQSQWDADHQPMNILMKHKEEIIEMWTAYIKENENNQ